MRWRSPNDTQPVRMGEQKPPGIGATLLRWRPQIQIEKLQPSKISIHNA